MATKDSSCDYIEDTSVESDLMCRLCSKPFKDPYCTPCDHTFCQQCLIRWILEEKNTQCPVCGAPTSALSVKQASRLVYDLLGRSRVRCKHCAQTGLQRDNFTDHLNKACPKVIVACPSADIKCPWTGQRDQLDNHLATCIFTSIRPVLSKLIAENQQLRERVKQLDELFGEQHRNQAREIQETNDNLSTSIDQLNQQMNIDENQIQKHETEIQTFKEQIIQLEKQINELRLKNQHQQTERIRVDQLCTQLEMKIMQLTKKFNLIAGLIGYHNPQLIDRIEKCDLRLMGLNQKKLNDQDMFIIVQQAMIKKPCKELNLQCNEITAQGVSILAEALKTDTALEILYLHNNRVSDQGVQFLAHALEVNPSSSLRTLELESNGITNEGAGYLAAMLKINRVLIHLHLPNNEIGDCGVQLLAGVLLHDNKTLEELVLDKNKMITDASIEFLIDMFKHNRTLKTLRIWECGFSETGRARLREPAKSKHGFSLSE